MKIKSLFKSMGVIALIVIAMLSCTSNKQASEKTAGTEYYRNLLFSETSYDLERGAYKLTAAEARDINR